MSDTPKSDVFAIIESGYRRPPGCKPDTRCNYDRQCPCGTAIEATKREREKCNGCTAYALDAGCGSDDDCWKEADHA